MIESELTAAARRLRQHYARERGGCKVLSVGADCTCPLCDIDRLVGAAPQAPLEPPAQASPQPAADLRALLEKWLDDGYTAHETPLDGYGREVVREVIAALASAPRPLAGTEQEKAR